MPEIGCVLSLPKKDVIAEKGGCRRDGHTVRCVARGLSCRFSMRNAFLTLTVEAGVRRIEAEQIANIREVSEKQLGNTLRPFPPDPAVDL